MVVLLSFTELNAYVVSFIICCHTIKIVSTNTVIMGIYSILYIWSLTINIADKIIISSPS